ncbi:hypothetical protein T4D_15253 [Trichinella pseudospiralis]|uniref:Uncharacterized protein n=1 Tax=Trichinella pseudospiralis TaxID=6337 RepID=A0A0V1FEI0_TRIPS|nr:hypothetical protein T4D_15253 [Trichinella pseudospiralis]
MTSFLIILLSPSHYKNITRNRMYKKLKILLGHTWFSLLIPSESSLCYETQSFQDSPPTVKNSFYLALRLYQA